MVNLAEEWRRIQWIPDRRPIEEWAAENITLPPALAFNGMFDPSLSRQFIAPFQSLTNDRVRDVCILAPPRSGKTLIGDIYAPHVLARDPGPLLWVFASDDQAEKHCETRLMPIIHGCPPIRSLLSADRHATRKTEIQLANGYPLHVVGPSLRNLQARGYRYLICDEVWQWEQGRITQAVTRVGDFRRVESSKVLMISQGGEVGGEWFARYTGGVIHEWEIKCDGCGEYQTPVFSGKHDDGQRYGIVWESDKRTDGTYDIVQAKASVRYVCRHCGREHRDCAKTQARWNRTGRYRVEDGGDPETHSYHWSGVVSNPWSEMVANFLRARIQSKRGNWTELVNFRQKDLAEFASEQTVLQEEQPVFRAEISETTEWPDEAARFMTVDVQLGHFWVTIRAWSKSGESRRLYWGRADEVQDLDALAVRYKVKPLCVVLDAAHQARAVYAIAAARGWKCIRGAPNESWMHRVEERGQLTKTVRKAWSPVWYGDPDPSAQGVGKRRPMCWHISKPATADKLQELRDRGLWVEPKVEPMTDAERDYQKQMDSMVRIRQRVGESAHWEQTGVEPHAWDVARIQVWCAMMMGFA